MSVDGHRRVKVAVPQDSLGLVGLRADVSQQAGGTVSQVVQTDHTQPQPLAKAFESAGQSILIHGLPPVAREHVVVFDPRRASPHALQILPLPLLPKRLNQNFRQANQSFILLAPLK
jgi:hypothetical protein